MDSSGGEYGMNNSTEQPGIQQKSMSADNHNNFQLNGIEDEFLDDFSDFDEITNNGGDNRLPASISDEGLYSYMSRTQVQPQNYNSMPLKQNQLSPSQNQGFSSYHDQKYNSDIPASAFYQPYIPSNIPQSLPSNASGSMSHSQSGAISFPVRKESVRLVAPDISKTSSGSVGGKSSSGQSIGSHSDSSNNSKISDSAGADGNSRSRNEISPDPKKRVADKKRQDRNSREQQRSYKISKQIDQLKQLLEESGYKVKNSKYDILAGVATYVKQLQSRTADIQNEIRTMDQQLSVKSANIIPQDTMMYQTQSNVGRKPGMETFISPTTFPGAQAVMPSSSSRFMDPFRVIASSVSDRNFRQYFMQAQIALALAATDGRIFECNQSFLDITGLQKEHVLHASIFKLVDPSMLQEAYINIGILLKSTVNRKSPVPNPPYTTESSTYSGQSYNESSNLKKGQHASSTSSNQSNIVNDMKSDHSGKTSAYGGSGPTSSQGGSSGMQGSMTNPVMSTGKRSRSSMEQQLSSSTSPHQNQLSTKQSNQVTASTISATSTDSQDMIRSFSVKSLIISAYDGKHLNMAIGVIIPDSNSFLRQNAFYPASSHQAYFSIALLPSDELQQT